MKPGQHNRIVDKLLADESIDDTVRNLVDAACTGESPLSNLLTTPTASLSASTSSPPAPSTSTPAPNTTLTSLEVRSFRGIGPTSKLSVNPGPGLTLIIGRNGSGKSSFAEALELLLTRECRRWANKPTVDWEHGWRNIHATDRPLIRATFAVQNSPEVTIKRTWTGDELGDDTLEITAGQNHLPDLAALGWDTGLAAYRPFLEAEA